MFQVSQTQKSAYLSKNDKTGKDKGLTLPNKKSRLLWCIQSVLSVSQFNKHT